MKEWNEADEKVEEKKEKGEEEVGQEIENISK